MKLKKIGEPEGFYSGYEWRGIALTKVDILCLYMFSLDFQNWAVAVVLRIRTNGADLRSIRLAKLLGMPDKAAIKKAIEIEEIFKGFPKILISEFLSEIAKRPVRFVRKKGDFEKRSYYVKKIKNSLDQGLQHK